MSGFILQSPDVAAESSWQFEASEKSFIMDHPVCGNASFWHQILHFFPLELPAEYEFNFVWGTSTLLIPDSLSVQQSSADEAEPSAHI